MGAAFPKDEPRAPRCSVIPDYYEVGAVWALGSLGDHGVLPEKAQVMEKAPRTRKPLQEFVFVSRDEAAVV